MRVILMRRGGEIYFCELSILARPIRLTSEGG